MKWVKTIISCCVLLLACLLVIGQYPVQTVTVTSDYRLLRAKAVEDDGSTIAIASEGDFAQKPSGAKRVPPIQHNTPANAVCIIFAGEDTANETFSWRLWAWRNNNGPAEHVANGTGVLGSQDVVLYPDSGTAVTASTLWADTLSITNNTFIKTWYVADSGNNRVAKLWGDLAGYEWIYCEITNAGDAGGEAGLVSVYYAYF